MKVEQLAVFLEDGSDRLAEITATLAENGISIRALSLADTAAYAIMRMIVNDTEKARKILQEKGFTVGKNEVLVIQVPDKPGGMASVLDTIKANKLQVEYMYAFVHKTGDSGLIIFRFSDPDQAIETLTKDGIRVLSGEEVYAI
ncbi:MAG: amino acid-binding protein [Desulfobulbaceae bacterium]|nr:amino acid-binding protein [Desulfobulbaceae bacterium]